MNGEKICGGKRRTAIGNILLFLIHVRKLIRKRMFPQATVTRVKGGGTETLMGK